MQRPPTNLRCPDPTDDHPLSVPAIFVRVGAQFGQDGCDSEPIPWRRARYDAVTYPLPSQEARLRCRVRAGALLVRTLEATIRDLVRLSLADGHEHTAIIAAFAVGIRAHRGHKPFITVRITGSAPAKVAAIILDIVPGCDHTGWRSESVLSGRPLGPDEQAWSNSMCFES